MNDAFWMAVGIFVWEMGKFAGGLVADWYWKDDEIVPCPHGHEDWDDCPDCCH